METTDNTLPINSGAGERLAFIICRNSQGAEVRGTLHRLTRYLAVFEVYNPYSIVQLSEVLNDFRLMMNERVVYSGRAVIANLVNTGIMLICEASLSDEGWIDIDILTPPNLASSHIDRERNPGIMLGKSPERDREIEGVQTMIKNCAAAKIPCIKYNMSILGVLRMGRVPGRADTSYSHFKIAGAKADPPLTKAGVVSEDAYWERITYFLERVIPVATEYKVRMACHPNDSPTPPEGYQGVHAVLSTVEGLKKFVSIKESPYHGFNFCIGTVSEMLMDPGKELYDVIRYFGTRKKIFNVHFRNILGNRLEFSEVAIDEGSFNAARAIATFKEVGYEYMVQHDHNVQAAGETNPNAYAAFVHGYIKALIQYAELA